MTPRLIEKSDLPLVAELEKECFSSPWSEQSLSLFLDGNSFAVGVFEGGKCLSYMGIMAVKPEGQITDLATAASARRRGLAASVLAFAVEECKKRGIAELTLEVRESNAPARALYEKIGFQTVGTRPRFYNHPTETAILYQLEF